MEEKRRKQEPVKRGKGIETRYRVENTSPGKRERERETAFWERRSEKVEKNLRLEWRDGY